MQPLACKVKLTSCYRMLVATACLLLAHAFCYLLLVATACLLIPISSATSSLMLLLPCCYRLFAATTCLLLPLICWRLLLADQVCMLLPFASCYPPACCYRLLTATYSECNHLLAMYNSLVVTKRLLPLLACCSHLLAAIACLLLPIASPTTWLPLPLVFC